MTTRFHITEQDYANCSRLSVRLTRRRMLILGAVALIAVAAILSGNQWARLLGMGALIGGCIGHGYVCFIWPLLAARHYRKYKAIHDEITLSLEDSGVRMASATGEGVIAFSKLLRWRENSDYLLLYAAPRLFYIVPKRLAAQGFDIEALRAQLLRQVGPAY